MGKKGKKKGGKKKGKKSGKKSGATSAVSSSTQPEKMSETGVNYYYVQINDLEKRLIKLQRKCDELEVMNRHFGKQSEQISGDRKDICEYLKKSLDQRGDKIHEVQKELKKLQEICDAEKESFNMQLQQVTTEIKETKEQLTSENLILTGKMSSMEEFKAQRQELTDKFAEIDKEIDAVKEQHNDIIYNAERVAVVDRDRLKKEMLSRVSDVSQEFRKVSNKQMAETTKRTIRENADLNSRLAKLSEKTLEIITENDTLKLRSKELKLQVELSDQIEKELAKKNYVKNKAIKQLVEECQANENLLKEFESEEKEEEYEIRAQELQEMLEEVNLKRHDHMSLVSQKENLTKKLEIDSEDVRLQKRVLRRIKRLISDTGKALQDANSLLEPDEEMTEAEMVEKRQAMLQALLALLNSSATLGLGPEPRELGLQGTVHDYSGPSPPCGSSGPESRKSSAHGQRVPRNASVPISADKLAQFGLAPADSASPTGTHAAHSKLPHADLYSSLSQTTRLRTRGQVGPKSTSTQVADLHPLYSEKLMSQLPYSADLMSRLAERGPIRGLPSQHGQPTLQQLPPLVTARRFNVPTNLF